MTIHVRPADPEPVYSEEYFERLEATMGAEAADWARLPREEREKEIRWYHENFNTPDDLSIWPPEMGGDENEPLDPPGSIKDFPASTPPEASSPKSQA